VLSLLLLVFLTAQTPPRRGTVLKDSLRYWEKQSPTYDGVLYVSRYVGPLISPPASPKLSFETRAGSYGSGVYSHFCLSPFQADFSSYSMYCSRFISFIVVAVGDFCCTLCQGSTSAKVNCSHPPKPSPYTCRFRVLDVGGGGVGRVMTHTLSSTPFLRRALEPAEPLLEVAASQGTASTKYLRNDSKLPL